MSGPEYYEFIDEFMQAVFDRSQNLPVRVRLLMYVCVRAYACACIRARACMRVFVRP